MWALQKGFVQLITVTMKNLHLHYLQQFRGGAYRKMVGAESFAGFLFSSHKLHFAFTVYYLLDYESTSLPSPMKGPCVSP